MKGEHDLAVADYKHSIQLDPNPRNAAALMRRSRAYSGKLDYESAIRDLDQALMLEPRNFDALSSRCFVRANAGAYDSALDDCNEALRLRPDNLDVRNNRAFTYLKKGALDDSLADIALSSNSTHEELSRFTGAQLPNDRRGTSRAVRLTLLQRWPSSRILPTTLRDTESS
jgi:tetratricopeptide (TPR) repeat protein